MGAKLFEKMFSQGKKQNNHAPKINGFTGALKEISSVDKSVSIALGYIINRVYIKYNSEIFGNLSHIPNYGGEPKAELNKNPNNVSNIFCKGAKHTRNRAQRKG